MRFGPAGLHHFLFSLACLSRCLCRQSRAKTNTVLGVEGTHFTLNQRPTFLLGFSYYGALGAPEDFIRQDLRDLRASGFNWLRVLATWGGFDTNVSAVTVAGLPREPFLSRLTWLVAECDRLGLVVDVTLSVGRSCPEEAASGGRGHPGRRPEAI